MIAVIPRMACALICRPTHERHRVRPWTTMQYDLVRAGCPVPAGSPSSLSRIQMDLTYGFNSGLGWTEEREFMAAGTILGQDQAWPRFGSMAPLLPSVGVSVDF